MKTKSFFPKRNVVYRKNPAVFACPTATKAFGATTTYWTSGALSQVLDTKVGVQDPKWKEKIASGVDATNPYTRVIFPLKAKQQQMPVNMKWVGKVQAWNPTRLVPYPTYLVGHYAQDLVGTAYGLGSDVSHPEIDTLSKLAFLAKIKQAQSEFNAPVFIGELKETIGMLRHPLKGFIKSTHRYRKRVKRLRDALKRSRLHAARSRLSRDLKRELLIEHANRFQSSLEKAFLQWTYGVAPLINDVKALLDLPAMMGEAQEVVRLSVTIPKQYGVRRFMERTTFNSGVFLNGIKTQWTDAEYKCQFRGALRIRSDPPNGVGRMREITATNLREFVPTVYELLPFSFIADYFSTLGDVVNGLFTCTEDLVYCSNTKTVRTMNLGIFVPLPGTQYPTSWPWIPAAAQLRGLRLNRSKANLSVGLRDLRFTMPDLGQLINTAVLSASLLRVHAGDR
jgi:hypothetical protein